MTDTAVPAETKQRDPVIPAEIFLPFALVTTLFALWGFANDVTNPLVKAFQEIFLISTQQSSLVQTAFYGGYATMALPAAIFIRRFSYKAGILVGLGLYATGALLFIPASAMMQFWLFLLALYILTFGLAFLETTANPYVLAMGPASTATRRLNFAQAFNPIGSLIGMVVASQIVLASLGVKEFRAEHAPEIRRQHKAQYGVEISPSTAASRPPTKTASTNWKTSWPRRKTNWPASTGGLTSTGRCFPVTRPAWNRSMICACRSPERISPCCLAALTGRSERRWKSTPKARPVLTSRTPPASRSTRITRRCRRMTCRWSVCRTS